MKIQTEDTQGISIRDQSWVGTRGVSGQLTDKGAVRGFAVLGCLQIGNGR